MKKLLYIIMFALVSGLTITSCTEEEFAPKPNSPAGSEIREL